MPQNIKTIKARKTLNSRGEWTLEVLAETDNFKAKAGVPGDTDNLRKLTS